MTEADNPATGSGSTKVNTAILRIAYLIAASDKDVNKEEREVFKKTLCALQGLKMGDDETTELIESVVEDARKFAILRDFYTEEEIVKAFLSKVSKDLITIQGNKVDCRKAFAVWTSICMADKDFSDFERKLVKGLQSAINGASALSSLAMGGLPGAAIVGTAVGGILGGLILGTATAMVGKAKEKTPQKPVAFGLDARIPDAFLDEVEERCREIDNAQEQLANSKADDERRAIEDSIGYLVESFKRFIVNVEA